MIFTLRKQCWYYTETVLIDSLVEVFFSFFFLKPYCLIQKMTSPVLECHSSRLILIYLPNWLQLHDKLFSCFIDHYTSVILTTNSIHPHTSGKHTHIHTHTHTHTYIHLAYLVHTSGRKTSIIIIHPVVYVFNVHAYHWSSVWKRNTHIYIYIYIYIRPHVVSNLWL